MNVGAARSGLPACVPAAAALYLKPLKPGADRAIELIVREGARVTRVVSTAESLDQWAARQPATVAARIAALGGNFDQSMAVDWTKARTPLVMGIVNATPDSFSDGGDHADAVAAIAHGRRLIEEGADVIDVGGESTRPGASPPSLEAELGRVIPVIEALAPHAPMISIDTRRAAVMEAALGAGAAMLNDVSALGHDPKSLALAARHDVPIVLMHMQGAPETMQRAPHYACAPLDVFDFLEARITACEAAGIARRRLIVDPGFGFGKSLAHNLEILRDLAVFRGLGCPIMVGASRKGFVGRVTGAAHPRDRLPGSLAAALHAVGEGATILRVHDVAATRQALAMWTVLRGDQAQELP
jgi:dihydropteroate synthase